MTADEQARHQLHERLDEVLGRDHAATLMSSIPPAGWAEIATKPDVSGLRHELNLFRSEVDLFRTDVDRRFSALEDRMDARFAAMDAKFDSRFEAIESRFESGSQAADHRFEAFDHELEAMEHRIVTTVHRSARDQTLAMVWANIGQLVALGGLVLTAVKL